MAEKAPSEGDAGLIKPPPTESSAETSSISDSLVSPTPPAPPVVNEAAHDVDWGAMKADLDGYIDFVFSEEEVLRSPVKLKRRKSMRAKESAKATGGKENEGLAETQVAVRAAAKPRILEIAEVRLVDCLARGSAKSSLLNPSSWANWIDPERGVTKPVLKLRLPHQPPEEAVVVIGVESGVAPSKDESVRVEAKEEAEALAPRSDVKDTAFANHEEREERIKVEPVPSSD